MVIFENKKNCFGIVPGKEDYSLHITINWTRQENRGFMCGHWVSGEKNSHGYCTWAWDRRALPGGEGSSEDSPYPMCPSL